MSDGVTGAHPGNCSVLEFPEHPEPDGTLSFLEGGHHIPFDIKRVFYLYRVPPGAIRANHALIRCHQCMIAISGSLDVTVDDGFATRTYHLDRPNLGLYVPSMVWRILSNFSEGAVCLVLASELYDPADYYRDYAEFKRAIGVQP